VSVEADKLYFSPVRAYNPSSNLELQIGFQININQTRLVNIYYLNKTKFLIKFENCSCKTRDHQITYVDPLHHA